MAGPPCGGKTTWTLEHAEPGDLILDWDLLCEALGSPADHGHPEAVKRAAWDAWDIIMRRLSAGEYQCGHAYVVRCVPAPAERAELAEILRSTRVVVVDPGLDECLARAAANRPGYYPQLIADWYSAYRPLPLDTQI